MDVYQGLDAYQAGDILTGLGCPQKLNSALSRTMISFWDLFISTGMETAEINPWRITPDGQSRRLRLQGGLRRGQLQVRRFPAWSSRVPDTRTEFEEEMSAWNAASHQGQAHVSDLGGRKILPILFGGGASTIIIETLHVAGGDPMFLSDFGGNPPYERMLGTAGICFKHRLKDAALLLILGGKANNTHIDVTFQAIADALVGYVEENGPVHLPVVIGRGGPRLVQGLLALKKALEYLRLPYVDLRPRHAHHHGGRVRRRGWPCAVAPRRRARHESAERCPTLIAKGDRVAVSNITGREASKVCAVSQKYCGNIVGGWALGKSEESVDIPVRAHPRVRDLRGAAPPHAPEASSPTRSSSTPRPRRSTARSRRSCSSAGGSWKRSTSSPSTCSIEVTAKIHQICSEENIDVVGCNTLGVINSRDHVRIGAVGGDAPAETFRPGSATIISNSGNMVNTIAGYLLSAGIGTSFGISTGKDRLILFPPKDFVSLALEDEATQIIVLYVEPGGTYEQETIEVLKSRGASKPILVYVAGEIAEQFRVDLGHAGAVVEGRASSARAKKEAFDEYFGLPAFEPEQALPQDRGADRRACPAASAWRRCTTSPEAAQSSS